MFRLRKEMIKNYPRNRLVGDRSKLSRYVAEANMIESSRWKVDVVVGESGGSLVYDHWHACIPR